MKTGGSCTASFSPDLMIPLDVRHWGLIQMRDNASSIAWVMFLLFLAGGFFLLCPENRISQALSEAEGLDTQKVSRHITFNLWGFVLAGAPCLIAAIFHINALAFLSVALLLVVFHLSNRRSRGDKLK